MKKIAKGLLYDTYKAKKISSWEYLTVDVPEYMYEELYRKKSGELFLYGKGGTASKYAKFDDEINDWVSGEHIMPLTFEVAQKWAKEKLSVEEYDAIFGILEDAKNAKVPKTMMLSSVALAKLDALRAEKKMTYGQIIEELLS